MFSDTRLQAYLPSSAGRTPLAKTVKTGLLSRISSYVRTLAFARQVAKERRQLAALEPHQLADIGLHSADVAREANRTFYDLPKRPSC